MFTVTVRVMGSIVGVKAVLDVDARERLDDLTGVALFDDLTGVTSFDRRLFDDLTGVTSFDMR